MIAIEVVLLFELGENVVCMYRVMNKDFGNTMAIFLLSIRKIHPQKQLRTDRNYYLTISHPLAIAVLGLQSFVPGLSLMLIDFETCTYVGKILSCSVLNNAFSAELVN